MTEDPKSESPITLHNRPLAFEVLKRTSTFSRYPRVSEQLECLPLETQKLFANGYNPSLNVKRMMVYRYHVSRLATRLAFAQLDDGGRVLANRELQIVGKSVDDPKIWTFNGDQYLSWVEALWNDSDYANSIRCVTKYAKFDGEKVGEIIQPKLPGNDGSEMVKNLVPWEYNGQLMFLFRCHPNHLIDNFTTGETYETDGPRWPYGEIRGGTPPVPYEGKLLRFFHSRLSNEWFGPSWRYYIGYYLMRAEPPFEVTHVAKRPLIYASEISDTKHNERPDHYKPNVVFPGGAIETNGGWILAFGNNDAECVLAKITPSQLLL